MFVVDNLLHFLFTTKNLHQIRDQKSLPIAALSEMIKRFPDFVVPHGILLVHHGSRKISPVDSILSGQAQIISQLSQLRLQMVWKTFFRQGFIHLPQGKHTVVVHINLLKHALQLSHFRRIQVRGNVSQCGLLKLLHANKFLECHAAVSIHGNGRLAAHPIPVSGGHTRSKLLQDPRMLQSLGCCQPGTRILPKEAADEVLCRSGNAVPVRRGEVKSSRTDMLENLIVRIAIEGRVPTKQDVSDDTNAPHVTRFGILSVEYLRCNIVRSTNLGLHYASVGIVMPRQAEINDFDRRILRLGLE
mmetsp:Transcript_17503/g.29140  ORF Transcript_17503/g.29140 Transcript_17503/m.29140 type:complete len:302 (-) Transcript_17503:82-987(-)